MSKLSEWMELSADNAKYVAVVAAIAISGALWDRNSQNMEDDLEVVAAYTQAINERNDVVEGEIATLSENYLHLYDMLESGDLAGAIATAADMKEHIQVVRENLSLGFGVEGQLAGLQAVDLDELSLIENLYAEIVTALRSKDTDMIAEAFFKAQDAFVEEYDTAGLGM